MQQITQLKKVLVANRGEIAVRIFRACYDLGLHTVAIYSNEDTYSLFRTKADEAYLVGEKKSPLGAYLDIPGIIGLAKRRGVTAIHPGYGFLSENADFARACEDNGILFVGPSSDVLAKMGDKLSAKEIAVKCGVPIIPGCTEPLRDADDALEKARSFGFPVILKASAGGGGRGMRIAHNDASLVQGYHAAKTEAENAFGNGALYMEKFLVNPRHIEVQILADNYGNVIHLGERDCSVQRRNQKLIEESPSPALSPRLRERIGAAAVKAAKAAGYTSAGTIEFLFTEDGSFYFMEMNTRIQVEHPVTEMVTRVDLIREQIKVAAGERLAFRQKDIQFSGHAIECRINAEDPFRNFTPSPGRIELFIPSGGPNVRMDTHVYSGYRIPAYYDSMIGKLIVWGPTRADALATCRRALDEITVEGIKTTIPFQKLIVSHKNFIEGKYDTGFVERLMQERATPHKEG